MAISNITSAAIVADAVLTESIDTAVRFATASPHLYERFMYVNPNLLNTKRWSLPLVANPTATVAYTDDGTEVPAQALTPTAVDIDTALYATSYFLGDWATKLSVISLIPASVNRLLFSVGLRLETDSLALVSSMTNTRGSSATTFDRSEFEALAAAFRTTGKSCATKPIMILSEAARRDFAADLAASGTSLNASQVGVGAYAAVSGHNQGEFVEWGGFEIGSSSDAATVSGAKASFVCHANPMQYGLAMAFSLPVRIIAGNKPESLGVYMIASHAHGVGIAEQARCYRQLSKP